MAGCAVQRHVVRVARDIVCLDHICISAILVTFAGKIGPI